MHSNVKQPFTILHAIYIVADGHGVDQYMRDASAAGWRLFELALGDIVDHDELEHKLVEYFRFPHKTVGFDAAVDLIADLEWLGPAEGNLLIARGLDDCPEDVSCLFGGLLPEVIDRWRTQCVPFIAVLESSLSRPAVLTSLRESNQMLHEAGSEEWNVVQIGRVPVLVDGRPDTDEGIS